MTTECFPWTTYPSRPPCEWGLVCGQGPHPCRAGHRPSSRHHLTDEAPEAPRGGTRTRGLHSEAPALCTEPCPSRHQSSVFPLSHPVASLGQTQQRRGVGAEGSGKPSARAGATAAIFCRDPIYQGQREAIGSKLYPWSSGVTSSQKMGAGGALGSPLPIANSSSAPCRRQPGATWAKAGQGAPVNSEAVRQERTFELGNLSVSWGQRACLPLCQTEKEALYFQATHLHVE